MTGVHGGFDYIEGESTCNIFHQGESGLPLCSRWRQTPIPDPILPIIDDHPLPVSASSRGFIICRDSNSNYYVGNPYAKKDNRSNPRYRPLPRPSTLHSPDETHVVLVVHHPPGAVFLRFHIVCAIGTDPSYYTFDTYSSHTNRWVTDAGIKVLKQQAEIVPNTGVSCGQFACWLTKNRQSVLKYDVEDLNICFLNLPPNIPFAEQARMQLGRVGSRLGFVNINLADSKVEVYTYRLLEDSWNTPHVFNVEIEAAASPSVREERTLVCSEMPWPLRFESFKIETLFLVGGRLVVFEANANDEQAFRLCIMPGDNEEPSILNGFPCVCTKLRPSRFDWGDGFNYVEGESTTNIFFINENNNPVSLIWQPTPFKAPNFVEGKMTICSSSHGIIVCRRPNSEYYTGNPYAADSCVTEHVPYTGPLTAPPTPHPPERSHVVLVIHRLPQEPLLLYIVCAIQKEVRRYEFHTYSLATDKWDPHGDFELPGEIISNTGVSCERFAFWLTREEYGVVKFDTCKNSISDKVSFFDLPPQVQNQVGHQTASMRLGRVGARLGLVSVNETVPRIEFYTRCPYAFRPWKKLTSINLVIEPDAEENCRREGWRSMVCREVPRPMRFESFKMEALLWVAGKIVVVERHSICSPAYYIFKILPHDVPASILDGFPHVYTNLIPSMFCLPG